jgi:hypothetical protein
MKIKEIIQRLEKVVETSEQYDRGDAKELRAILSALQELYPPALGVSASEKVETKDKPG